LSEWIFHSETLMRLLHSRSIWRTVLLVGLVGGCRTHGAPRSEALLNAADAGALIDIPQLADTLARFAAPLPPCVLTPAPAAWPRVRLRVFRGTVQLPRELLEGADNVPDSTKAQSWSALGDNVVIVTSADSVASGGLQGRWGQCALRVSGRRTPLRSSAHQARPGSRDSVYVAEVDAVITPALWLHAQVATHRRSRLDTLLGILGSLDVAGH
jgi:hypothetical protein